ncbi:MAG: hypothetical protein J6O43_07060 [Clostridium sp.]|nr:hypothetical protein [Clostridium sp.]
MGKDWKDPDKMETRELLAELVRNRRRDSILEHAAMIANFALLAIMVLTLVIVVPKAVMTLREVDKTVKEVNTLAKEAQDSLDAIDIMVGNVDKMVVENTDAVTAALEKVNKVDYEKLNDAISSLNDTVTPLAKMLKLLPIGRQ